LSPHARQSHTSDASTIKYHEENGQKNRSEARLEPPRCDDCGGETCAALSDPDNRPLTEEDMKRMKRRTDRS